MSTALQVRKTLAGLRRARADRKRDAHNAITAIGAAGGLAYLIGRGTIPPFIGRKKGATTGGVETPLAVGGLALGAGIAGIGGKKWSDNLLFAGIGMVCPGVAQRLFQLGVEHGKEPATTT